MSSAPDHEPPGPPQEQPAVVSPGDSDAPDAPDSGTIYPDERGVPGEPDDQ